MVHEMIKYILMVFTFIITFFVLNISAFAEGILFDEKIKDWLDKQDFKKNYTFDEKFIDQLNKQDSKEDYPSDEKFLDWLDEQDFEEDLTFDSKLKDWLDNQDFVKDIILDGKFLDWLNKPKFKDPWNDEEPLYDILQARWHPDTITNRLYLYFHTQPSYEDWEFNIYLNGDIGLRRANVYVKSANKNVKLTLYDEKNKYLWSARGKWSNRAKHTNGFTRVEMYIPIDYLVSSTVSGYQIDIYSQSRNDRVPDNGYITVSTISTLPYYVNIIFIIIVIILAFKLLKKAKLKNKLIN